MYMKVAIVTINDYENYGNRLQNYALEKILSLNKIEVSTLVECHRTIKEHFVLFLISIIYVIVHIVPDQFVKGSLKKVKHKASLFFRRKNMIKFSHKNINERKIRTKDISTDINSEFDMFVAGSDQIWNTNFWKKEDEYWKANNYLLKFSNPIKRVAYAASIGKESIDSKWIPVFIKELSRFQAISVREESAKRVIEGLPVNKNIDIVLDPTLLINPEEWRCVIPARYSEYCKKHGEYLFVFFLGNIEADVNEFISKISKEKKMKIIDINSYCNKKMSECDPFEFITWIHNAKFVITDSFHATIFSILFEVPFLVMERRQTKYSDMSTRIASLLNITKLTDRYNNIDESIISKCNFVQSRNILKQARKESLTWLLSALNM